MEIFQVVKKLNSISRARFRRRPVSCTALYRNPIQTSNFGNPIVTRSLSNLQQLTEEERPSCLRKIEVVAVLDLFCSSVWEDFSEFRKGFFPTWKITDLVLYKRFLSYKSCHRPFSQLRTWPRKKPRERQCRAKDLARTANLQSFRMEKQEMASLSTSFFRL